MKKLTIKLNLDERKYDALHTCSTQKGIDIDAEFVAYFEKMYKKIVPKAVREYIEGTTLSTVSDPVSEEKVINNAPQLRTGTGARNQVKSDLKPRWFLVVIFLSYSAFRKRAKISQIGVFLECRIKHRHQTGGDAPTNPHSVRVFREKVW